VIYGPFTDAEGWGAPQYYATIHSGDVQAGTAFNDTIQLEDLTYQVDWQIDSTEIGRMFVVRFVVSGMELGLVSYTPDAEGTVPIRFRIDTNARIRARVLHGEGYSAAQLVAALMAEFNCDTIAILAEEGYGGAEVGEVLRDLFGLDALAAAQKMRDVGFSAVDAAWALKDAYGEDIGGAAVILYQVGYPIEEVIAALQEVYGADLYMVGLVLRFVLEVDASGAAQILKTVGFSAVEVGTVLRDVFDQDAQATAQILKTVGFSAVEVGTVLRDVFGQDAQATAQILKDVGYSASSVYQVLRSVFGLSLEAAKQILEDVGYPIEEIFEAVIGELAIKFAPHLRFDNWDYGLSPTFHYPMSAQFYYENVVDGPLTEWSNTDSSTVSNSEVPTYWKASQCGNQIRIVYWSYYGYQPTCDGTSGSHHGDWEHVMVILSEDTTRIAAVTFYQHDGWYTRVGGEDNFVEIHENTHPVVYVGRQNHGSFHWSESWTQTCCYWDDHRNGADPHLRSWENLVQLRPVSEGGEAWMDADLEGGFSWGDIDTHPMQADVRCDAQCCHGAWLRVCHRSGCWQTQCGGTIPTTDEGLLY
jgi:hypothetical protein